MSKSLLIQLAALTSALSIAPSARAIHIVNFSFEDNPVQPGEYLRGNNNWLSVTEWGRFRGGGEHGQDAFPTHGNQMAFINSDNALAQQSFGDTYSNLGARLFVDVAGREPYGPNVKLTIGLFGRNLNDPIKTMTLDGPTVGHDMFRTYKLEVTGAELFALGAIGSNIGIVFKGTGTPGYFDLDNVRLFAVP